MTWIRLKHACIDAGQYGMNIAATEYVDEGIRLIRTTDLVDGRLAPDEDGIFVPKPVLPSERLAAGDLLLSRSGTIGRAFLVPPSAGGMAFAGFLVRFHPRSDVDPRFLYYTTQGDYFQAQVQADAITSTIQNFNAEKYANVRIWVPCLDVQRRMADLLDDQVARIDEIIRLREEQNIAAEERFDSQVFSAICGASETVPRRKSNLSWLGDMPAHWLVATVGSQFSVMLGKMLNDERARGDSLRPYLRNTNVQWDRIDLSDLAQMDFPRSERSRYAVLPGDLLICEGGQPGRAAIWHGQVDEVYYQKALHRARPREAAQVRWLFYLLRAAVQLNVFGAQGNQATIAHLTGEQLNAQRFPFPPRSEQLRLIASLDAESRSLAELQSAMRAQIDLFHERKRSLITAAVTGEFDVSSASGRGVT